jgi:hydroquinone glucosyltransferase
MGISHLIPFLEFAKRLVSQHSNFHVTCIIPTNGPTPQLTNAIVEGLPNSIDVIFLPPVSLEDLPETTNPGALIFLNMSRSLPSLRKVLESLLSKTHLAAFLTNFFGVDSFDVAKEFNIPSYIFYPSPATVLSLFMHLPKLHETVSSEIGHLPDPVKIPGCIPIPAKDIPGGFQDLKGESHERLMHIGKRISSAEGIVLNSFKDMESGVIKALQDGAGRNNPPVYPIGPLIQAGSSSEEDTSGCLRWLDNQPRGSVLYVSFGSGGTLSCAQIGELALGLEMSGQKFLWVVRRPSDESPNAAYLSDKSQFDPSEFLPSGFLERTKGQGLVVTSWAPQTQILNHGSTGGFLSHCGWSSTLESIMFGVPIIAWPLFAEQKTNALILEKEKKVALRPKANENELVEREEIAKVVKDLMEGEEGKSLGQNMRELKDAAARALSKDGSSTLALSELASKWENVEAPKVE